MSSIRQQSIDIFTNLLPTRPFRLNYLKSICEAIGVQPSKSPGDRGAPGLHFILGITPWYNMPPNVPWGGLMSNLRYFGWSRRLRLSRALSPTPTCESEIYDSSVPNSRGVGSGKIDYFHFGRRSHFSLSICEQLNNRCLLLGVL